MKQPLYGEVWYIGNVGANVMWLGYGPASATFSEVIASVLVLTTGIMTPGWMPGMSALIVLRREDWELVE